MTTILTEAVDIMTEWKKTLCVDRDSDVHIIYTLRAINVHQE